MTQSNHQAAQLAAPRQPPPHHPTRALAHCDGLDGPVVAAARQALDTGNPAHVLIWVQSKDEPEIRTAFERTLAVRELSPDAKELADRFFFDVKAYVDFIHYVERLYETSTRDAHGHFGETEAAETR